MKALVLAVASMVLAWSQQWDGAQPPTPQGPLQLASAVRTAPTILHVDDDAEPGGDGSGRRPFNDIADALALAGSLGDVVVIVAPGTYPVSRTLRIASGVDLRGSIVMDVDAAGLPTGSIVSGTDTRIVGTEALGSRDLVSVAPDGDGIVEGVEIRNLTFDSGVGRGTDLSLDRAQGYFVHDNVFTGGHSGNVMFAANGVLSVASSGRISGNYFSVTVTGAALAAGYPASPSAVDFVGNRAVHNVGGLVLIGSTTRVPVTGDQLDVRVQHNDLSENTTAAGFSFGLRIFTINRPLGAPGDTQATGNVRATIADNRIDGNEVGISIDAGFPFRLVGTSTCDPRMYAGTFELDLRGNTLSGSRFVPSVIAFTRNQAALHQAPLARWQYLHGATYEIRDADGTLADALIDHPEVDPFIGPCPNDATNEALQNKLIYNGLDLAPTTP